MIYPNRVPGMTQNQAPTPYRSGNAPGLAFGSGGEGLSQLGHGLMVASQVAERMGEEDDRTRVMEADQQLADFARMRLYDPEVGYFNSKGRDAVTNAPLIGVDFDAKIAELSEGLDNDRQRQRFQAISAQRRTSDLGQVDRYSMNERETWLDQVSAARIQTAIEDGSAQYGDPKAFLARLGEVEDEVRAQGERKGWGPELTEAKLNEVRANYVGVIAQKAVTENPAAARAILQHNRGVLTDEQSKRLSQRLNQAETVAQAKQAIGNLDAKLVAKPMIAEDMDKDAPAFSPDRDAFSMLKTVIDVKKGDDIRLKTLLTRYHGNITLALAAHSAGTENVDKWVKDNGDPRMGMIADQDFIQRIPDEKTRNAVQLVADKMGGVANGSVHNVPSIASMAQQIVNDPDLSPNAKGYALQQIGMLYSTQMKQRAQQQFQADEKAYRMVDHDGVSPDSMPSDIRDALGTDGMAGLRAYVSAKAANGGAVKTDNAYFNALPQMASSNPGALLHLGFSELRANLDDAQLAQVMKWRKDALSGKRLPDVGISERLVIDFFKSHGLEGQRQTQQQALVRTELYGFFNEAESHLGRPLSYPEKQKILDDYSMKVVIPGRFGGEKAPLW